MKNNWNRCAIVQSQEERQVFAHVLPADGPIHFLIAFLNATRITQVQAVPLGTTSLKRKCDHCEKPATHHSVEIIKGQKIEKHLCDTHASQEGLAIKTAHTPINELLTNFVKLHSGAATTTTEVSCDHCGLTFAEFREHSLMGCPNCYTAFKGPLSPLVERAQEGGTHHIGKVPHRVHGQESEVRQQKLLALRKRMGDAVTNEDYELAARLRDEVRRFEEDAS